MSAQWAGAAVAAVLLGASQDPPITVPRELRLAQDQAALRGRVEALETTRNHEQLIAGAAALLKRQVHVAGYHQLDGWAVARNELNYLLEINQSRTAEGPILALDLEIENHALQVIPRYARELNERGIELLVVPVPNRAQLWGEHLPGVDELAPEAVGDLGTARLLLALSEAGVEVVDLLQIFADERARPERDEDETLFRRYNPHWAPGGVVLAADTPAQRITQMSWFEQGPEREGVDFFEHREYLEHAYGANPQISDEPSSFWFDLVLDESGSWIEQVNRESPILIIGDSYSDIYRAEGASIAVQLYSRLGFKMDRVAVANGGAQMVWKTAARRRDGLAGKKLVIWIFRNSEFAHSRFRFVDLFGA